MIDSPDRLESEIEVDQDTFEEAVSRVNVAIHDFDFEIKKSLAQVNGNPLWAIVNPRLRPCGLIRR